MNTEKIINLAKISMLSLGFFVASCSTETFDENPEDTSIETKKVFFMGDETVVQVLPDGTYLLDDMKIFPEQVSDSPNDGVVDPNDTPDAGVKLGLGGGIRKWSNNTVVYVLDRSLSANQIRVTRNSMDEWSSKTAIRFKERTNENFFVTIVNSGNQCNCASASLGASTRGRINMGVLTSEVVMIHEIGHTLGYVHEQTRRDRDDHVIVNFQNIQAGAESQFRLNSRAELIGEFDLRSTMMYGSFTFSKNGQPTIVEKSTGRPYPRRRAELSPGDIAGTNQVYPGGGTDPDPNPDPNPDPDDICDGVDEWVRGQRYQVGDKVTFRGFLFERDFTRWNRIGRCGTEDPAADICENVEPFNGNNSSYSTGDRVTYQGSLYERQSNGRWTNLGQCGS
ncbi:M12 family metallopeptidase [Aquimarina sp. RZ0]|uniref:M12 family metallopeptidase n=1 Tax=Aquimarina sp. RZ0 TaxID=2607730 RepID=UPI0011F0A6B0|nr:M12 family metallopeptidase [Aquimarina sp. RZ0]KAA1245103.1 peptidase M12 [Aquimarina sp. RZ0]